jgi:hypothetical protein
MIKKTADGVEIVKGMKVWISPAFELDDGDNINQLKICMDEHIVSSLKSNLNPVVSLKREKCKMRWTFDVKNLYADKKKALTNRIDILRGIIFEKRDDLNYEIKKANEEIDAIQDFKNDLDKEINL